MRSYWLYLILALFLQREVESIHGLVLLDDRPPGKNNILIKLEINPWGGSGSGMPTQASEEGEYWFHQLAVGEYEITASAPGYRTARSRIELFFGGQVRGTTKLNLEKTPELPVITYDGQLISRNELAAPPAARKHLATARGAFEKNDLQTAAEETDRALKTYPQYANAIFLKGRIFSKQGRASVAADLYEQCLSLDSDLYAAYLPLAEYYREQERGVELRELTGAWKKKQPTESPAYFYSAIAQYEAGEYPAALRDGLLSFSFPHAHLPHLRLLLANIYVKLNQPAEALAQLEAFLKEYPNDSQVPEAQETIVHLKTLVQKATQATDKER